jgi:hypothetical protein
MTTIVIDNSSPQAQELLNYISTFPFARVIDESAEEETFERIPGLAYTHAERIESIRKAEENIRNGKVYSAEEVRAMFPKLQPCD